MEQLFTQARVVLLLGGSNALAGIAPQLAAFRVSSFSLVKPAVALRRDLATAGVNDVNIIDTVSHCKGDKDCAKAVAMEHRDPLSQVYEDALTSGCTAGLLPDATELLKSMSDVEFILFIGTIAEKTRVHNARLAILAPGDKESRAALKEVLPFMDRVIDLSETQRL